MTQPTPDPERRADGWMNWLRRGVAKYFGSILFGVAGMTLTFAVTTARGVLAAPGKLDALTHQVQALSDNMALYMERTDSLQRGQSVTIAFKCLELPDSVFNGSLLPCGEAFRASRLDPQIWRRLKP